ncbi:MAG TPA: hypothetical protein PK323_10185 [Bacteroidia bacterium]|nr:hypothetical protein [Bacteroidia bacterium]
MKTIKNILLTFDYELFLGAESGTAQNCLILPTNRLLDILNKHQIKAIFFVDILYLLRLKEIISKYPQAQNDYDEVCKQIATMSALGHYVYLHIHPHWLDAIYIPEKNQWNLSNTKHFALSNLNENEGFNLLEKGYQLLHEIISTVPHAHKIEGYRAGGLFIQPFQLFYRFLKQYHMPFEFSVYPYFTSKSQVCSVDFSHIPKNRIYKFENDCCVEEKRGYFTEYTISEITISGINRLINSGQFRINTKILKDKAWGDGKGAAHVMNNNNKKIGINGIVKETAAVELMNLWKNKVYMTYLQQHQFLHFLSHPKLVSPLNLVALESFIINAQKKYQVITDFKHFLSN